MTSIEGAQNHRVDYTEGNPWDEITRADSEEARKKAALQKGLPAHSSWREINYIDSEEARENAALQKGLPVYSSWDEITRADKR